ncbi:type I secretion system permease/ATPase [Ramlibacter albus]|uniref:Type I secretion system permease/ATPase n=1 Tax=Ramlibacter albus TaxID=2079448 RepID=A0A923S1W7_9BURK|nr:type I secretion system permease/ATPase [Ramlibacter albus]MBC5764735.1 type I secretion system permease/ATPase [Ramlibacter albus]
MTPVRPGPSGPSELREALESLKPTFLRVFWFSVLASLLVLMPSWYMLEVYDRVVNSRNHLTLTMLTLILLAAFVLMEVLEWARAEMMTAAGIAFDTRLRDRVFTAMFEANLRKLPGATAQPMNDLRTIREFLPSPALLAALEAPVSIVFLAILFAIHPVLGWSALVGALVQALIGWLNERGTKPPLVMANRIAIEAQQYADGSLRNAQVIESMGMIKDIHRRWMVKQRMFLNLQAVASDKAGVWQALGKFTSITLSSALLGLGAWLLLRNDLRGGGGMMIVGSILGGRVLQPALVVVGQWRSVVNFRDAWRRLDQMLSFLPPPAETMKLPAPRGALVVEGLMAGAPNSQAMILRGVQFAVSPGEAVAVVGPSASGKTTLARLLVGLWPAASGKVRLDGVDVFTWDKSQLGPHIGYLPQGIELFDGTIAENIARFGQVEPHKVEAAAKLVGVHEFILALPQGYDTPVGHEGAVLSGGQRQRIALARALYGDPVFVVLDEPNSSLDDAGDAALASAVTEMKKRGTTFVVMTHRTSILAVVDKMLVLRDGQAQAFGPRDEVLQAIARAAQAHAQQAPARPANPFTAAVA